MKLQLFPKTRERLRGFGLGMLDIVSSGMQVLIPGGGAAISFAVGKWVAGLILVLVTAAVLMRLLWRRKHADRTRQERKLPVWAQCVAGMGALAGSAVLVEMTKLPVRFDQPGFSIWYWLIVVAAIWLLNSWLRGFMRSLLRPKTTDLVIKP
jgi:hypothetical protein